MKLCTVSSMCSDFITLVKLIEKEYLKRMPVEKIVIKIRETMSTLRIVHD